MLLLFLTIVFLKNCERPDRRDRQGLLAGRATTNELILTYVGERMVKNDHVGNEWSSVVRLDGREWIIGESRQLTFSQTGSSYLIECTVWESNETHDDRSGNSTQLDRSRLGELYETGLVELDVLVTENHGRYSGNQAIRRFTFSATFNR